MADNEWSALRLSLEEAGVTGSDQLGWNTLEELRIAIVIWIERTYHRGRPRLHSAGLTPIEYELIMARTATQAAWLELLSTRSCSRPNLMTHRWVVAGVQNWFVIG